jgi:hypothetical protein
VGLDSGQGQDVSLLHNVQTGSGAHPASYTVSIGGSFTGDENLANYDSFFNPLSTEFLLNYIKIFSSYLTGNILRLRYKAQPVNAVWGNIRCLL